MSYGHSHFMLLMACMVRDDSICRLASGQLQASFFTSPDLLGGQDPLLGAVDAVLFESIDRHFKEYKGPPDLPTVRASFQQAVEAFVPEPERREAFQAEFESFAANYLPVVDPARAARLCQAIVAWIADVCVFRVEAGELLQGAAFGAVPDDLAALADKLQGLATRKAASAGSAVTEDLFAEAPVDNPRRRSGLPWMDSMFGGGRGMVRGAVAGIIAPMAHGKTTMGVLQTVTAALQGETALLCLAEEGLTQTVRTRIMACATSIDTQELEGVDLRSVQAIVDVAVRLGLNGEATAIKIANVRKHLKVLDLVETEGGFEEIETTVANLAMSGRNPECLYIDWAGKMADRIMAKGLRGRSFKEKRDALSLLSECTAELAYRHNNTTWISQQMTTEASKAPAGTIHTQYVAMDCQAWAIPFKYLMVLGTRDKQTGIQQCRIAKARDDAPDQFRLLKMHGAIARFEDVSDAFQLSGKNIRHGGGGKRKGNSVPSERKDRPRDIE